jgi:hypothetical protein
MMNIPSNNHRYVADTNFQQIVRAPAVDVEQFQTIVCKNLFTWWHSFLPKAPSREQFDILDHVKKAPNFFLIAALDDMEFDYQVQGEEVIRLVGRSNMGWKFSAKHGDEGLRRYGHFLEGIVEDKIAMHSYGTLNDHGKSYLYFESLF